MFSFLFYFLQKEMADDEVFVVETILDSRLDEDGVSYFVKWLDYDDTHNSWVISADMDCPELLAAFETQRFLALTARVRALEHRLAGSLSSSVPTSHDNSPSFVLPDSTTGPDFGSCSIIDGVADSSISSNVEVVGFESSIRSSPVIEIDHSFLSDVDSVDEDFSPDHVPTPASISDDIDAVSVAVNIRASSNIASNAVPTTSSSTSIFPPPFGVKTSSGKYACDWITLDGDICGKVLSTRFSIKRHIDRVHLTSGVLQCCDLVFSYYGALKRHQQDEHST